MKRLFSIFLFLLTLHLAAGSSVAQTSQNHNVSVTVGSLTYLSISTPTINLTIDNSVDFAAGQDAMVVTDQTSYLYWATNASDRKVTVATDLGTPLFQITLAAVNVVSVDPSPGIVISSDATPLSTTAQNLLEHIGRSMGYCNLLYTGTAYASVGTGTDIHHLVFTVQTE